MNEPNLCASCRIRRVPSNRSVCHVCYPTADCTADKDGLCTVHSTCAMVRGMLASLEDERDRMVSALQQLREHIEHDGGATCDIRTMLQIISEGEVI